MTDASLLVIMTADVQAWNKQPDRYWKNAPSEIQQLVVNWIGPFHEGREWLQRDEAQRSIGIAMQTLMLAAKSMGYESCPMIGFDIEGVAKLINLPDDHVMGPMVAIGKGVKAPWPKPGQLPLSEVVVETPTKKGDSHQIWDVCGIWRVHVSERVLSLSVSSSGCY